MTATSVKQRLMERRQRNAELAQIDKAHRCPTCQINLAEVKERWESVLRPGVFCSETCLNEAATR